MTDPWVLRTPKFYQKGQLWVHCTWKIFRRIVYWKRTIQRLILFLKKKLIGRYQDLVDKYSVSTSQVMHNVFVLMLFIFLTTCYSVLLLICLCSIINFTFTVGLFYVIFIWRCSVLKHPVNVFVLSFIFAGVFCICDFLYFFGSYNVTLYFKRSCQYVIVL